MTNMFRELGVPALVFAATALVLAGPCAGQQTPSQQFGDQITSHPISIDVDVLDAGGVPVISGLAEGDFAVLEDGQTKSLLAYEPPTAAISAPVADPLPVHSVARTVMLLDVLNAELADVPFAVTSIRKFLIAQPAQLASPTELLVLGDTSLNVEQRFTVDREALLHALDGMSPESSMKARHGNFAEERYQETITALREIAMQNRGEPGRVNVLWLGRGGPNLDSRRLQPGSVGALLHEDHETANLLVYSRTHLYLVFPGNHVDVNPLGTSKPIEFADAEITAMAARADFGASDPFDSYMNFGVFVNLSGGAVLAGQNDMEARMASVVASGIRSYTLSYLPLDSVAGDGFRRIRVSLRNADLHLTGQKGYFQPDLHATTLVQKDIVSNLTEVVRSSLSYDATPISVQHIVRHPDSDTVEVSVLLYLGEATWEATGDGSSSTAYRVAVASLNSRHEVLRSKLETLQSVVADVDPNRLQREVTVVTEVIHTPKKTGSVRFAIEDAGSGRIGTVEIREQAIADAPAAPTPAPVVRHR